MQKTMLSIIMVAFLLSAKAATTPVNLPASAVMIPLIGTDKVISLKDFISLTPGEYKAVSGKKMGIAERLKLKTAQKFAKRLVMKDGTVDITKLKSKKGFFDKWSWHWGGFALGFLIILGPIICLFFNDEYKWDRFWTALFVNGVIASLSLLALQLAGL
jgi:hypothetical protein